MHPLIGARRLRAVAACAVMASLVVAAAPAVHAEPGGERGQSPSRSQRGAGQMPAAAFINPMGSRPITATHGEPGSWWFQGRHDGIDYDADTGDLVRHACSGTVTYAGSKGSWAGKHVIVRCATGLKLTYAHLSRVDVKKGDSALLGARLGAVGSSGNVTGSHLHVSAELNGRSVNPAKYIPR